MKTGEISIYFQAHLGLFGAQMAQGLQKAGSTGVLVVQHPPGGKALLQGVKHKVHSWLGGGVLKVPHACHCSWDCLQQHRSVTTIVVCCSASCHKSWNSLESTQVCCVLLLWGFMKSLFNGRHMVSSMLCESRPVH